MATGALIGAYQEDDAGGLRALLPLAGETLLDYQVRCLASVGAAPIVVFVEKIPPALQLAFERLRAGGIAVVAVSDAAEAASRFEAGSDAILLADGIVPDLDDLTALMADEEPNILTVPDDEAHQGFERIDGGRRWSGLGRLDAGMLGATAATTGQCAARYDVSLLGKHISVMVGRCATINASAAARALEKSTSGSGGMKRTLGRPMASCSRR